MKGAVQSYEPRVTVGVHRCVKIDYLFTLHELSKLRVNIRLSLTQGCIGLLQGLGLGISMVENRCGCNPQSL